MNSPFGLLLDPYQDKLPEFFLEQYRCPADADYRIVLGGQMQTVSRRPALLYPVFWLLSKWDLFFPETGQDFPATLTISPGRNQAGEAIQVQEHGFFSRPCTPPLTPAYMWAARFPHRHRQIFLVGLAGKILGPIGFVWALANGSLPASF